MASHANNQFSLFQSFGLTSPFLTMPPISGPFFASLKSKNPLPSCCLIRAAAKQTKLVDWGEGGDPGPETNCWLARPPRGIWAMGSTSAQVSPDPRYTFGSTFGVCALCGFLGAALLPLMAFRSQQPWAGRGSSSGRDAEGELVAARNRPGRCAIWGSRDVIHAGGGGSCGKEPKWQAKKRKAENRKQKMREGKHRNNLHKALLRQHYSGENQLLDAFYCG